ncbi:PLP-dependent transferase [Periconia macrospinosa]|uniref:PLP-dependent transferase n=1 Tax=Periconia macrospinosa TaxID=97972 RepID=A0A2V1D7U5_9PLEO|nr:PLP-dependent transferase [Periconia macrospinosa]
MVETYKNSDVTQIQLNASSSLTPFSGSFHPDITVRSPGLYIWTSPGHRILDWTPGQMSYLIGHGHPEVVEVIKKHAESLDHLFSTMITSPVISLATRLTSLTPGLDKAFFLSTGGESNEAAIRLAKFYTGKFEIVGGALGAQYQTGRKGYGPNMPGSFALPALSTLRKHCSKRGMLIIHDEAQTALGRGGDMFAYQHDNDGFVPNIITLSKTLGNGIPLSAVLVGDKISNKVVDDGFFLYSTHLNDPLPAAVGDKVLQIVLRDNLASRARFLDPRYACIGDVRGRDVMAGVEIVLDRDKKTPGIELGNRIDRREDGGVGALGETGDAAGLFGGVEVCAPLITSEEADVRDGLEVLERAFKETGGIMLVY